MSSTTIASPFEPNNHPSPSNPWLHMKNFSAQIPLSTHTAFARVSGPRRTSPTTPIIIAECGGGDFSSSWPATIRAVSPFARIFVYDRAGLGASSAASAPPTASSRASQLLELLQATGIKPPYVLVGFSYGGPLVTHFLSVLKPGDVVGMLFVDSPAGYAVPPMEAYMAMLGKEGGAEYMSIIGLDKYRDKLTEEEWAEFESLAGEGAEGAAAEAAHVGETIDAVEKLDVYEKKVVGDGRVSALWGGIVSDFEKILAYGESKKNGTDEQREVFRKFVEDWKESEERKQKKNLEVSREGRLVRAPEGVGHSMPIMIPVSIAKELKWVLRLE